MPARITGATPDEIARQVEQEMHGVLDHVTDALDSATSHAAESMRYILHESHTPTGIDRVSSGMGRSAGRYETGRMHDDLTSSVTSPDLNTIIGSFGWAGNPPDYYADQEYGFNHPVSGNWVAGMNAFQVTTQAIADFERELARRGFRFS